MVSKSAITNTMSIIQTDLEENFAEKWNQKNEKAENFFRWNNQLKQDLNRLSLSRFPETSELLFKMFGEAITKEAYSSLSDSAYRLRSWKT